MDIYDAENGTGAGSGVPWKVKVPGYGVIYMETGRFVIDLNTGELLFDTGHNQYWDGDIAALCNALK